MVNDIKEKGERERERGKDLKLTLHFNMLIIYVFFSSSLFLFLSLFTSSFLYHPIQQKSFAFSDPSPSPMNNIFGQLVNSIDQQITASFVNIHQQVDRCSYFRFNCALIHPYLIIFKYKKKNHFNF